jgi:hypothetical protein
VNWSSEPRELTVRERARVRGVGYRRTILTHAAFSYYGLVWPVDDLNMYAKRRGDRVVMFSWICTVTEPYTAGVLWKTFFGGGRGRRRLGKPQ